MNLSRRSVLKLSAATMAMTTAGLPGFAQDITNIHSE